MGERVTTQREIDEYTLRRAKLEPIAQSLGIAYDDENHRLMQALSTIALEQERSGSTVPRAATPASRPRDEVQGDAQDMGDRVVAILYPHRAAEVLAPKSPDTQRRASR